MPDRHHEARHSGSIGMLLEAIVEIIARQGRRQDRKRLFRRALTLIAALALVALLVLAACQASSDTTTPTSSVNGTTDATLKPNYLSSFMLAQRVAESINQQDQVISLFQSIPDAQRRGILLDEYVQYIRLLRRMANGSITSLTRIGDDELSQMLKGLRFAAGLKHEGFYFQTGQTVEPTQRVAFFQQVDEDGTPYLDRAPIVRVLSLQNYAALYFDAIDRSDRDALAVLIRSSADTQDVRLEKADRILAFYHNKVATASPAFRVDEVMPDRIAFVQNIYEDAARTVIGTRHMTIYADGAAGFIIDDPIPDTLKTSELRFLSDGKMMFDLSALQNGQMPVVTSSQLGEIAGMVLRHDDSTCTLLASGEHQMTAYYNGIIVEGVGRCDRHQFWRMQVSRLTLTDGRLLTASGIGIGQPLNTLLLNYPFADETGGVIEGQLGTYKLNMAFTIENKTISRIILTISEG